MFLIISALTIILAMILASILLKNTKHISLINIAGNFLILILILFLSSIIYKNNSLSYLYDTIYIDSLSIIHLIIVISISFIVSIYSYKYIDNEISSKTISLKATKIYYILFTLFLFSMLFVVFSNNILGMWLGLEGTTIATAFLIGFNKNKLSLEAAWKYIIICSIGIGIGFVGILLFIYSFSNISSGMLNWTTMLKNYHDLNPATAKIAFVLIFIGIGTKAELAPMHTWLPDALSEAPSPVSAMLSGTLLNVAFYVITRFYSIVRRIDSLEKLNYLFIAFGCLSLIIASYSMLKQTNYKRLFAFSSVENIGIVSLGLGFGGTIGIFGSLLHLIIHAYAKTLMFLISGNLLSAFKTKRVDKINGLIKTMPINSILLLIGIFILTGAPPFASFFSEYNILLAGIEKGYYFAVFIYILCLIIVLASFLNIFVKMIFKIDEKQTYTLLKEDRSNLISSIVCCAFIVLTSVFAGGYLITIITKATAIICG